MEIQIATDPSLPGLRTDNVRRKLEKVLNDLDCHDGELSVLFTDDARMAALNARYLNRKGPTNVLAFPMAGGPAPEISSPMLGDVVVSVDTVRREAAETGETEETAMDRLVIHGVLHLLGFDHETGTDDARRMESEKKRLLGLIREE